MIDNLNELYAAAYLYHCRKECFCEEILEDIKNIEGFPSPLHGTVAMFSSYALMCFVEQQRANDNGKIH